MGIIVVLESDSKDSCGEAVVKFYDWGTYSSIFNPRTAPARERYVCLCELEKMGKKVSIVLHLAQHVFEISF